MVPGRIAAAFALLSMAGCAAPPTLPHAPLARIETQSGGRLGVAVLDSTGRVLASHRGEERFALCSTFKLALAAAILAEVDRGEMALDDSVPFDEGDMIPYAPTIQEAQAAGRTSLTIRELITAIVQVSDNVAANLLLDQIGGPAALTGFVRLAGDRVTRLDRSEPALNENAPGDPRDTTSPVAQARLLHALFFGDVLGERSRRMLRDMALGTKTGASRLPAGIAPGWRIAHKTGSCGSAYNDIAVVWPQSGTPFVVTAYLDRPAGDAAAADNAIADVARYAASIVSP